MGKLPVDLQTSTRWAIASVESAGMILVGHTTFDLVNLHTVRAHRLELAASGISGKLPISGSFSMSNYTSFTTRRPVNFKDFDARGARQTTAAVIAYSMSYLTIFDGPAYISPVLCYVKMAGWGPSIPSIGLEHGVTEVIYGDGKPLDMGGFQAEPEIVIPSRAEEIDIRVQITKNDEALVIKLQGDTLFDFDKYFIKQEAEPALKQAGSIIRSLPLRRVDIDGHADGKGNEAYNVQMSMRRANAVADWFISHKYLKKGGPPALQTKGWGKSRPIAPNTRPDGSDDPVGRAKNRRVEIFLIKK
jgi:outer membrane protein OmpA-like peptidoglycan-associated protein